MPDAGARGCDPDAAPVTASRPLLTVACAVLVDADGRVLVAERPAGKPMAGLWEFPGGKLDPHETPEAALVRELEEELGIRTHDSCLAPAGFASHAYEDFHLVLLAFAIRKWMGQPTPREGQRLHWAKPQDLWSLPMPPADRPLLAQLAELL